MSSLIVKAMWSSGPDRRGPGARAGSLLRPGFDLKPGMRVGLYGGSFDPPHGGHRHVAKTALKRLGLDRLIWLVSPQNPLKPAGGAADLAQRVRDVRTLAKTPGMIVSDIEAKTGARFTVDTIRALKARYPGVDFVWIMGADNLAGFHRWRGWTEIMRSVPVAVIDRPGLGLKSRLSPAARRFSSARIAAAQAGRLARMPAPAWVYLTAPLNPASSTEIRRRTRGEIST